MDASQAGLVTSGVAGNFAGAIVGSLVFLALLYACTQPAQALAPCPCCAVRGKGEKDDTTRWKATAPLALGRARGASYLLLQGLALLGAGLAMP